MNLPPIVSDYLMSLMARRTRPFTVCIDHDWRIQQWWGEPADGRFKGLAAGQDVRELAPFLIGQNTRSHVVLPLIAVETDHVFHVHNLPDDDVAYIVFMPADDERSMRQNLQQTANEVRLMNQRQQELLAQLSAAKEKLERRERDLMVANEIKARFIAGMSHEFRTPLTAILGYSELIDDNAGASSDIAAHSQSVGRAARHLLSMVDNILDQARLDGGAVLISYTDVNVRELVDDLAAIMAPLAAARLLGFGAYVSAAVPQYISTDVVRLRQVLLNLLGNAVKFTDDGEVRLELDWVEDALHVVVIDTGPGVAADELESIFGEFHRGRGSDLVRGVGLGLNIARRLMEVLGGTIGVESTLGEGSRFYVRLPASIVNVMPREAPAPNTIEPAPSTSVGAHILVAEDDPDIIDLVQIILGRAKYEVSIATNGRDAVERALQIMPDLVLMDVNMPHMNGMQAAAQMRRAGLRCPIIALSASLGVDDRDGAIEAGYDTYLVKPIASADLLAAIEQHLRVTA